MSVIYNKKIVTRDTIKTTNTETKQQMISLIALCDHSPFKKLIKAGTGMRNFTYPYKGKKTSIYFQGMIGICDNIDQFYVKVMQM